ncbi:hypothetical protein PV326_008072 [Microctonus aethiopoides]|nr:hypothetical protein PV326_008072 [Microctonus aethiopoides]
MANELIINNDEFAYSILNAHPFRSISRKQFLHLLATPGPKEKHPYWQRVCEVICDLKNLPKPNRSFFKRAHRLFMENYVEIEKIIIDYILKLPMEQSHDADILEFFYSRLDKCRDEVDRIKKNSKRGNK